MVCHIFIGLLLAILRPVTYSDRMSIMLEKMKWSGTMAASMMKANDW